MVSFMTGFYSEKCSVAVLGHSFVSSYSDHLFHNYEKKGYFEAYGPECFENFVAFNLSVDENVDNVYLFGQSGATVSDYSVPRNFLSMCRPRIILLDLGTNDLVNQSFREDPLIVGGKIMKLACSLVYEFSAVVVLLSIVPRASGTGVFSEEWFLSRARDVNGYLKWACFREKSVFFRRMRGFYCVENKDGSNSRREVSEWSRDGIHANNEEGRHLYAKNLRGAISEGLKQLYL